MCAYALLASVISSKIHHDVRGGNVRAPNGKSCQVLKATATDFTIVMHSQCAHSVFGLKFDLHRAFITTGVGIQLKFSACLCKYCAQYAYYRIQLVLLLYGKL